MITEYFFKDLKTQLMKTILAIFAVFFCGVLTSTAQNENGPLVYIKQEYKPQNEEIKKLQKIVIGEFDIRTRKVIAPVEVFQQKDWMAENWNNFIFNPYKHHRNTYPFNVRFADSTYASPIRRKKVITSHYGWRKGSAHKGIDIDLVTGDKVIAMLDGKVRYVKYHYGHGRTVVIRHKNGLETVYAHLSKQLVKVNDSVVKGQVIGKGGISGNARGSHLHLEVRYKGVCLNPEYFFDFGEENKIRSMDTWVTSRWATPHVHTSRKMSKIEICNTLVEAKAHQNVQRELYTIKRGDTLSGISSKFQVSIYSLCKANSIRRSSLLRVGQRIILGL